MAQSPTAQEKRPPRATTHSVHWDGISLGDAIARIRRTADVDLILDRRIDSNQRVNLTVDQASAVEVVAQLADRVDLGIGRIGDLLYLGPRDVAERLPTLAATRRREVAQLPDDLRRTLTQRKRIAWPRLSEPHELIARLAAEHGWRVDGEERIPFDVWPAGQLPRHSIADQLTVLLAEFDLTYRLAADQRAIEIIPVDWRSIEPSHAAAKQRPTAPMRGEAKQVYSLRIAEQPVGAVLTQLARRLGWKLEVDESQITAAGRSMDTRVSFAVENADADQLLEALLKPAGLRAERDGNRVRIVVR